MTNRTKLSGYFYTHEEIVSLRERSLSGEKTPWRDQARENVGEYTMMRILSGVDTIEQGKCWQWLRYTQKNGYGRISVLGKRHMVHVAMYLLCKGEYKSGNHIMHLCNNCACVNPGHLISGTPKDNARHAYLCGKRFPFDPRGETNPSAKITAEQALEIVDKMKSGEEASSVSREYGIGPAAVRNIINGARWSSVTGIIKEQAHDH